MIDYKYTTEQEFSAVEPFIFEVGLNTREK